MRSVTRTGSVGEAAERAPSVVSARVVDRRSFLRTAAAFAFAPGLLCARRSAVASQADEPRLGTFTVDVTPPLGHPLCGGWIPKAAAVDHALEARGAVFLGSGDPVVVCSVDWTGILNRSHLAWRESLARAARTTPDRVAVHCVHQHNAPFACEEAQAIIARYADLSPILDVQFQRAAIGRVSLAVKEAVENARRITHVAVSEARVDRVASNRRIIDRDGKLIAWRSSSTRDPRLQELPEGLVDPSLKTVAWFDRDEPVASFHYYATHPMSYYGDGRVTSDFVGLARARRDEETPGWQRIYFTGCAGNVAAGKYNDGSPEARRALTDRLSEAMKRSEEELRPRPIGRLEWRSVEILPSPRELPAAGDLERVLADSRQSAADRGRAAYRLAWLQRAARRMPIVISALRADGLALLHLPGECFVEYQLRAQAIAPRGFVATAAYGDGGVWYVPTAESYPQGGYEVSVAFCAPAVDATLGAAMRQVLG